jgi:hypothetical protein
MNDTTSTPSPIRSVKWWAWLLLALLISLAVFFILWFVKLIGVVWQELNTLDSTIVAAIVAGFFTVIGTAITVMVGRYYEAKRKRTELHRERKIEMYDAFIARIFKIFANSNVVDSSKANQSETDLIEFLREHQRKFLLWSDAGVIRAFSEWRKTMTGAPTAKSVLKMEAFFLAVRRDLGHSNLGIKQGDTVRMLLRHTDLFLAAARKNQNVTLAEIAELEKKAGLE